MPQEKGPVAVLWNTGSGWNEGEEDARRVQAILADGRGDLRFCRVKPGEDLIDESRKLLRSGSRVVVAAGATAPSMRWRQLWCIRQPLSVLSQPAL